jgi:NAD(P)-dependent dehydrogenase (short-subunit alcohol dehydrogenase family)
MSWRDITEEPIDHVLAVDIEGTMTCIGESGKRMLEQGQGCIVNVGSTVIVCGSARTCSRRRLQHGRGLTGERASRGHLA